MAMFDRGKAEAPAAASRQGRRVKAVLATTAIAVLGLWWSVGAEEQAPPTLEQATASTSQANAEAIGLLKRTHACNRSSTDTDFRTTFSLATDATAWARKVASIFRPASTTCCETS